MKYYLLDTCSYIAGLKYTGKSCLKHDFLELSKTKQCGIYIPQSCVPEVGLPPNFVPVSSAIPRKKAYQKIPSNPISVFTRLTCCPDI